MCSISIIVPVYNDSEHIEDCIYSITSQALRSIEIIVIDDGSTDKSWEIISRLTKEDTRIKAIQQENQGVSVARNRGLDIAQGNYITFVDSDDMINNRLEQIYSVIEKNEVDIALFGYEEFGENIRREFRYPKESIGLHKWESIENLINSRRIGGMVWAKVYRAKLLEQIRFPANIYPHEDGLFTIDALSMANTFYISDEILYYYRQQKKSVNHSYRPYREKNALNIFEFMQVNIFSHPDRYAHINTMIYDTCILGFVDAMTNEYLGGCPHNRLTKIKTIRRISNSSQFKTAFRQAKEAKKLNLKRLAIYYCSKLHLSFIISLLCYLFVRKRMMY